MNAVEFENVTRVYPGGVVALDDVNLKIPTGAICGLVGRNGAGKSTLLSMIPALLHPSEGEVRVFGLNPWEQEVEIKRDLGYLSENDELPGFVQIQDIIDLHRGAFEFWDVELEKKLLAQFDLKPNRRLGELSKGQKRQVSLLAAVCHRPKLLVLDEPAGGLDPVVRRSFLEVVINLLADTGTTVLLSSHILADLERVANTICILHRGKILLTKQLDELKEGICRVEAKGEFGDGYMDKLTSLKDCLRAEMRGDVITATLLCALDEARKLLLSVMPEVESVDILNTKRLSLEDIFIELTGGTE